MIWAYEELGWGGYWGWDPVENAALLPWFTATAFLHSVMVQERRSMLRVWNVVARHHHVLPDDLRHVHDPLGRRAVGARVRRGPALAWLFTGFMVVILTFSFGLVIYRLPLLRARNELDSWVSREAAFLVNNWILLFSAFFVLFATMFPTLSEAVTGERLTVGPAVLQQMDAADRPRPAVAHRRRSAARVAQVDAEQPSRSVSVARSRVCRHRSGACGARHSCLGVGVVLRALRDGHGDHPPGVLPRGQRPPAQHRNRHPDGTRRPRRPQQAPLRRLHRRTWASS